MREARAAARIDNPHVTRVLAWGTDAASGAPYLVMERLRGGDLAQVLASRAPLEPEIAVAIFLQAADGVAAAHSIGVVHRDIKPSNLFLLRDGTVKVVDFGVARIESSELTETGAILGTPAYMSPEQFLGLPVDGRSDLFSVGIILYHLLTGDRPFSGSPTTIMQKVLRQDPIEPTALNPTLAPDWDTVIKRALAKKPEQRFQSARQFADAVRFVAEGKALPKAPEFLNDATVQVPPTPKPEAPARKSRSWIFAIVGAVAAAAAAAGTAVYVMRPQPPAPAPVAALAPPPVPKPAPVVEISKPAPVPETPKPEPVVEAPKPAARPEPAAPPPAAKERLKQKMAEKKAARQAERQKLLEPPPMAYVDEPRRPAPAGPSFRAKVVSLDRSWGFAVVELAERGSVKVGDRLTATVASGRRVDMVVRRISGNLASAIPEGRLSDDLVGASVTRN